MTGRVNGFNKHDMVGYEVFLPTMAAALRSKKKKDANLSDTEFKQVVAVAFKDAMIQFCKESRLYTVDVPIDFYEATRDYSIVPPDGFSIVSIIQLLDGVYKTKNIAYDLLGIRLPVCPTEDIRNAIYVRMAIKPTHLNDNCKFHREFIDRYFEEIRSLMFHFLHMQDQRIWADLGRADRYLRDYRKKIREARRRNAGVQSPIRRKGYAITDVRHPYNR